MAKLIVVRDWVVDHKFSCLVKHSMKSCLTLSLIGQFDAFSLSSQPPIVDFKRGLTADFLLNFFLVEVVS